MTATPPRQVCPAGIAALSLLWCASPAVGGEHVAVVPQVESVPRGLLRDNAADQPSHDLGGRPNLCVKAHQVLLVRVAGEEARLVGDRALSGPSPMIVTKSALKIETTILGDVHAGDTVYVDQPGGEYGDIGMIVSGGGMSLYVGMRYLVVLGRPRDDNLWFDLIARYSVPRLEYDPPLPSAADLRAVLVATCEANPDGIYFHQAIGPLSIPPAVRVRNPNTSFKWELFGR